MSNTKKAYTMNFKLKVINDRNAGMSLNSVAAKYEINTTQVHCWTKKYNELGNDSFIDHRGRHKSPLRGRQKTHLKDDLNKFCTYSNSEELREAIDWTISYYNNRRIHTTLKMSPVEYRTHQRVI